MSGYKVIILPLAEEDIAEQADYIAYELSSPQTAINMVNGLKNAINNLSIFPRSHELDEDEDLSKYGIRRTYYKNYRIYFLIDEEERTIFVLRVLHMLEDNREKIWKFFTNKL